VERHTLPTPPQKLRPRSRHCEFPSLPVRLGTAGILPAYLLVASPCYGPALPQFRRNDLIIAPHPQKRPSSIGATYSSSPTRFFRPRAPLSGIPITSRPPWDRRHLAGIPSCCPAVVRPALPQFRRNDLIIAQHPQKRPSSIGATYSSNPTPNLPSPHTPSETPITSRPPWDRRHLAGMPSSSPVLVRPRAPAVP
jgi:hypothetical protein